MGTDFWLGFMPNYIYNANNIRLFIATGTSNEVWVDAYCGANSPTDHYHTIMTPNSIWTVYANSVDSWETHITEQPQYRAIHVHSRNPITVYGLSNESLTTDSYLALPTDGLGSEYYPSCYYDDKYTLGSPGVLAGEFLIIAPYDFTRVTIGPVTTPTRAATPSPLNPDGQTVLHQRGSTWTVTLMKGQTYLVQSTGLNYGDDDLTGTHIVSDHPIGLLSGHVRASIPIGELADQNGSKDHLMEMIPSVDKWGTQYYDMPMAGRPVCGDLVRVIAGKDGETVNLNSEGRHATTLLAHAGDFYNFDEVTEPSVISSAPGEPFLAVQMAYSQGFDGDPGLSDPFSIVLTPQEEFQKKLIFRTPDNRAAGNYTHYATFVCLADSLDHIRINGKLLTSYIYVGQAPITGSNPPMAARRIQMPGSAVTYVATCGSPFGCYLYGFSQDESYGHPAGMALNVISPDTLPPLEAVDTQCGNYQVELMELRHEPKFSFEDTKISDIEMIADTLDPRWPKPSYNYSFSFDPSHPFTSGDSTAYFNLTVANPAQDAYAAVWTTDRAGNDTVYEYRYSAPKIQALPSAAFKPIRVTTDSCQPFIFTNLDQPITITTASILGPDSEGLFQVSPTDINKTLQTGNTLRLEICYTASDTALGLDTLALGVACNTLKYPLVGLGVTPLIIASDVDFGNVPVGMSSAPKQVTVKNVGKAPLTLDKNWKLDDNTDFSFADASQLPVTIPAGGAQVLSFVFTPQAALPYSTLQHWGTDLPAPFAHQIKDTSVLKGIGVQAGLNWDRPSQGFTTECSNPVIDTVYLMNPTTGSAGTDILVSGISISGPDSAEFSIVGMQFAGNNPPWLLREDSEVYVIIKFTPDLSKGYGGDTAVITAYGASGDKSFNPQLILTGTIRHATLRVTPPSFDYGTVKPGDSVGATFYIHNDGDTTLVLSSFTANNGFIISGYSPNQQVMPGDSAPVIIYMNSVPTGPTVGTALAVGQDSACTASQTDTLHVLAQFFAVASTGHGFGGVFVCQDRSAQVSARDSGSLDAVLVSARIVDTLGSTGASQYTFANGSQFISSDTLLHSGESAYFTVNFSPEVAGGGAAYVVYTWYDSSTQTTSETVSTLTGLPLHYVNTLSVAAGATGGVYEANPAESVTVPVTFAPIAGGLDAQASIYGIRYILRYKRDMFMANPTLGNNSNGIQVIREDTGTDPQDAAYILDTVVIESNIPITQSDSVLASIQLEYVVNKDSMSSIDIIDPVYMDSLNRPVCWVSHDTIPAVFAGLDKCGNTTLRNFLSGGLPTFKIQSVSPDPVSSRGSVAYSVRLDGVPLTMDIYDELGRVEHRLLDAQPVSTGTHTMAFDTRVLSAGNYVLRVTDGATVQSVPFVVEK